MTRKTTAYARKRANLQIVSDHRFAGLSTLARCRPFDEAPPFDFMADLGGNATQAAVVINDALADLLNHQVEPSNTRPHDIVAHAVDIGHIRTIQIDGEETNPHHLQFMAAKAAMNRLRVHHQDYNKWALTGSDRDTLADTIALYEAILNSSSPEQMDKAVRIRRQALAKGQFWAPRIGKEKP